MKSYVFSKTCRLCLSEKDNLLNIFDLNEIDLAINIYYCVSLNVKKNDSLPSTACTKCVDYVINWAKFRTLCHESDKILRQALNAEKSNTDANDKENLISIKSEVDQFINENISDQDENDIKHDLSEFYTSENNLSIKLERNHSNINSDTEEYKSNNMVNCDNKNTKKKFQKPHKKTILRSGNVNRLLKKSQRKKQSCEKKSEMKCKYKNVHKKPVNNFQASDDEEETTIEEFLITCERQDIIEAATLNYKYVCEICSETQDTMLEFLNHQEIHEGQPVFKCDNCSEVFSHKSELLLHEGRHPVPCPQCEKMVLPKSLQVHMNMHTDRYKCPLCGLRFCNSAVLSTHNLLIHTDIKEHVCETCGKRFSTKTALKLHHKSHSDIRAYPCKLCSYAGRTASGLYTHMSQHANENVVCEICAKIFKSRRRLNDHKWRIHNMHKKHECHCCHKKFADKYKLTVHMRTHTGAKPYQCQFCDRAFGRSEVMKQHQSKCESQRFAKLNVIIS